jgi:hypothetical protein
MSLKWLWISLIIIGLVIFGPISLYSLIFLVGRVGIGSIWGFIGFIPILITVLLILGLIKLSKKGPGNESKKDYKALKPEEPMKIQSIFYIVGVIFIFAAVWYFAKEYIAQFPNSIKLILLIVSTIVAFIIAEFMRGADK